MTPSRTTPLAPGLLLPPTYRAAALTRKPSTGEVFREWFDAVAFWRDPNRRLPAFYAGYHLLTGAVFVWFFAHSFSLAAVGAVALLACFIATVYNTVWYHRYCSHRAFTFRSLGWARLFLWTNPVCFREESYVVPHRLHHSRSDEPNDPYGPHLGWLGSYLATESQQKMNRHITRAEYQRLAQSLAHIGFVQNTYSAYQATGSVENVAHYLGRFVFINVFWCALAYLAAGWTGVGAWISAVFLFTVLVRDFNFRGHAGLLGNRAEGVPLNQFIYGLIAGEWHENHHAYPRLARSGLRWWQIDLPYAIVRVLHLVGVVRQFHGTVPSQAEEAEAREQSASEESLLA
jgi:fatty-acid desaturase